MFVQIVRKALILWLGQTWDIRHPKPNTAGYRHRNVENWWNWDCRRKNEVYRIPHYSQMFTECYPPTMYCKIWCFSDRAS